jgi:SNF2 family DNA or RNA helicase
MNLPEVVHNDIVLELPPKLRKVYTELETEFYLEFPNGIVEANSSGVLDCKLRQFMQGALYIKKEIGMPGNGEYNIFHDLKIQQLQSTMDTSAGNPILAPVQFKFEYDMICNRLDYDVPIIAGRTPATRSAQLVREWNEGKHPLLVVHPRSVAYSLNMQFGGHTIFWVALPWEMDLYKQLIRRLRRQGQTAGRVIVHRCIFADTVDAKVAEVLARKSGNQDELFEAMTKRSEF